MEYVISNFVSRLSRRHLALFVILTVIFHNEVFAQTKQTHRFEHKQKGSDEYYTIIPMKAEGLTLIRERNKYNGSKKIWEITLLDTTLRERNTFDLEVENRYPLIGYEYEPGALYLLFRTGDNTRNNFELINLDISAGMEVARHQIKPEIDFRVTHFSKVGSKMVLGGYVSNEPAVILYTMSDNQIKVVPGFFQKDNELVDLRVNENKTFNAVMIDRSMRSERKLVFRTFDESGKLLLEDVVPIAEDRTLQTSISSTLQREDLLLLGTWGDRSAKQSTGFFSLPVDPFNEQKINFISFGELEHFTDYLTPKRAQRVKENAREDVREGRRPTFANYVMPYKVEEHPEGFLLLAEVYQPSTVSPSYSSPYNNPYYFTPYSYYSPFSSAYYPGGSRMYRPSNYGNNVRNADEIKTHASVLIAFDAKGKPLWDHSIKLDELKKPALEQVTDYFYDHNYVYFLYKKESDLVIKTINMADGSMKEVTEKIKLDDPKEEIKNDKQEEDGVRHWHGNSFYVWGYQTIRNNQLKDERVRDVFFINKVVVR